MPPNSEHFVSVYIYDEICAVVSPRDNKLYDMGFASLLLMHLCGKQNPRKAGKTKMPANREHFQIYFILLREHIDHINHIPTFHHQINPAESVPHRHSTFASTYPSGC